MKTLSLEKAVHVGRRYANVLRLASNVADAETVTIGKEVYEIDNNVAVVAGNIRVDCTGGLTPVLAGAALVAAINANTAQGIIAKVISANEVLIATRIGASSRQLACAVTLAGANNVWAAALMYGGSDVFKSEQLQSRAVVATEVALGGMRFAFPFNPISALVQVRSAAGAPKAWGGTTTLTGDRVDVTNTGATDLVAGDLVTVLAGE